MDRAPDDPPTRRRRARAVQSVVTQSEAIAFEIVDIADNWSSVLCYPIIRLVPTEFFSTWIHTNTLSVWHPYSRAGSVSEFASYDNSTVFIVGTIRGSRGLSRVQRCKSSNVYYSHRCRPTGEEAEIGVSELRAIPVAINSAFSE